MRRNYYLVMAIAQRLAVKESAAVIYQIFPEADERDHLIKKLEETRPKRQCFFNALLDFYMLLDRENQMVFDRWYNKELDALERQTLPHIMV